MILHLLISPLFHFNSIKVRLELEMVKQIIKLLLYLNSIKVRLEPLLPSSFESQHLNFNSIKVRLERFSSETQKALDDISIP